MKKIPYGISNYKKIIEEDYLYVDKTMYLEKLENISNTLVYLRPGRFGKSLFTSMMYYYYDINSKKLFDRLFKGTYVGKNYTKNKNNYYILKLDFSGITTAKKDSQELEQSFVIKLKAGIKEFASYYGYNFTENINYLGADQILISFINWFQSLKLENKLYIIIDEYDNFTNAILSGDGKRFLDVVGNEGFLKSFYAIIKEYLGLGVIDRFFATGICPITLDAMTTGFNISTDISNHPEFNSMIGFSHEEVYGLIDEFEESLREEIYNVMYYNYDGYTFNKQNDEKVFNATLVMYYLKSFEFSYFPPEELMDKNIIANYSKIERLLRLQNNLYFEEILNDILTFSEIKGSLTTSFNLEKDFKKNDIISLLYYFGYLTIKKSTSTGIIYRIPNEVMKKVYTEFFLNLLEEIEIKVTEDTDEFVSEILEDGSPYKLTNYIEIILKELNNRLFLNFNEKNVQLLYYAILLNNKDILVILENETKGRFSDIILTSSNYQKRLEKYSVMIKLKYIKEKNYSHKHFLEKKEEGIKELKSYKYLECDETRIRKYLIIFVGKKAKLIEKIES